MIDLERKFLESEVERLTEAGKAACALLDQVSAAVGQTVCDPQELLRRITGMQTEARDWEAACRGAHEVIRDIGNILGADMPAELVNEVAARRMAEIETLRAALVLADARINDLIGKTK